MEFHESHMLPLWSDCSYSVPIEQQQAAKKKKVNLLMHVLLLFDKWCQCSSFTQVSPSLLAKLTFKELTMHSGFVLTNYEFLE